MKMMTKTSVLGMHFFVLVIANFGKKPTCDDIRNKKEM